MNQEERLGICEGRRLLYVSDPSSLAKNYLPDPVEADDLRRLINMMADSGVDMYCQEVYSQCWTEYWRSEQYPYDQREQHGRFTGMLDEGIEPLDILIDESRNRDMLLIAGFRVNDGHGYRNLSKTDGISVAIEEAIKAHPDWELSELPNAIAGGDYTPPYYLDFSCQGVRDYTIGVIKEVVDRFDVDGIELCFRDNAYFPVGAAQAGAELMTEMLREIRRIVAEQAKQRNKKLVVGARVFSSIEECLNKGLDVPAWVSQGLLDYLSPQDVMWTDFNLGFGEFGLLTGSSNCKLYPGLLPWVSQRARIQFESAPIPFDTARAYAHSCYQNSADGVSVYNHCVVTRVSPFYPQLLQVFHELRDPNRVAAGARHYMFDSFLAGFTASYAQDGTAGKITISDKMVLERSEPQPAAEYELHLYESPDKIHTVSVLFRGFNMTHEDELEIRFNDHLIDDRTIGRTRISNAPPEQWSQCREDQGKLIVCIPELGRIASQRDARVRNGPPHSTRWFPVDPAMLVSGRNCLSVKLTNSDADISDPIVIEEVEIWVQPR